jgi:hypothetical protein
MSVEIEVGLENEVELETVQRQAAMMAFVDNFKMLGVVFFAVIPILVMMKKPRVRAGGVPVH